jgi:BirA family biotin operon repressor/biotin-[acetyl-CoA-carboxylase] ligase
MAGAPEGLVVVAGEQTAGRGRLDRRWISPAGAGIYLSLVLRPPLDTCWSLLPLMAALAVHDALLNCCGLETDIKWPNDILAHGRKLCGILAETLETSTGRAVVMGIGINLTADAIPTELAVTATSVQDLLGEKPDAEELLQALLSALLARYDSFQTVSGPVAIRDDWTSRSSYATGKRVNVACAGEAFAGTTRGLEGDGALRVETNAGEIRIVRAGDVTSVRPANSSN